MDKGIGSFLKISGLLLALVIGILAFFAYILQSFTLSAYRFILILFIGVVLAGALFFTGSVFLLVYAYYYKCLLPVFRKPLKIVLNGLMPAMVFLCGIFNPQGKESVRRLYVEVNNILVGLEKNKYRPEDILILLPHCLQDSGCGYKITSDITNCKGCGKCCIGDIVRVAGWFGVKAAVVTGGTVARKLVESEKYKVILSVACERDLASGIADVRKYPVMGVVNERPNGPCFNTSVDVERLTARLKELLE